MKFSLVLVLVLALALPVFGSDVLANMTGGLLSLTNTAETAVVSHWSMKKGDFGGGAGVGIVTFADTVTLAVSMVAFQTRSTIGPDLLIPFSKLTKNVSSLWSQLIPLDGGLYAGWNYNVQVEDNYSAMNWGGFDFGISLIKRF